MDGYQLSASVIQSIASLAWPAALIGSVWLFRGELKTLLPLLRLKHKDWEMSFRLEQAEKEAAALPIAPVPSESEPTDEEESKFQRLAELSPRAGVMEIRADLDEAIRYTAMSVGIEPKNQSMLNLIRLLHNRGHLDQQTFGLLDDLRAIGNNAAHPNGADFTKDEALRYRSLAVQAWRTLDAVAKGQTGISHS